MIKEEFVANKNDFLYKAIKENVPYLSRNQFEEILKKKDIKINSKRVLTNKLLKTGDTVELYHNYEIKPWYDIVYEDNNIVIVNKKSGIEVVSEEDRDIISMLKKDNQEIFAVHRIDRNTEGLVIFAKNELAEKELLDAFKKRTITKKYLVEVVGKVNIDGIKTRLFLKKLAEISKVIIAEVKTSGYEEIKTNFKLIKYIGNNSLLEAELLTGKTHQIRAHLGYYGHYIVGDGKYGKGDGKLHLTSYFIKFHFKNSQNLAYLNEKSFEIMPTWL